MQIKRSVLTKISINFRRTHKPLKHAAIGSKCFCTPDVLNPDDDTCVLRARHLCPGVLRHFACSELLGH